MVTTLRAPLFTRHYPRSYLTAVNALGGVWQNQLLRLGTDQQFAGPGQFKTYDYPNPIPPPVRMANRTFIEALDQNLYGKDTFYGAPGQSPDYDWPNPIRARQPDRSFATAPPLVLITSPVSAPLNQYDWPLPPSAPSRSLALRTHIQALPLNLLGQDQVYSAPGQAPDYDWPNPVRRASSAHYQAYSAFNAVLHASATPAPFLQTDWPLPVRAPAVNRGVSQAPPLALLTAASATPFNLYDWPLPPRSPAPSIALRSFVQPLALQLLGQDQFFGAPGQTPNYDWPNPRRFFAPRYDSGQASYALLNSITAAAPFASPIWPNPIYLRRLTPDHSLGRWTSWLYSISTTFVIDVAARPGIPRPGARGAIPVASRPANGRPRR